MEFVGVQTILSIAFSKLIIFLSLSVALSPEETIYLHDLLANGTMIHPMRDSIVKNDVSLKSEFGTIQLICQPVLVSAAL
jgi:hypothetical protein